MARILGLDIDEHHIRAAWLESSFRKAALTGIGYATIPPSFDDEGRREALLTAARSILAGHKSPDQIVASMSGLNVSLRSVDLAPGLAGRIGEVLPHELDEQLPFELSDLIIDHQIEQQSPTQLRVLAAAVRKDAIRERLATLRDVGLEVRELAAGAAALDGLVGIVPALAVPGPIVLLFIGAEATDVCVLVEGRTVLARTLSEGADAVDGGRLGQLAMQVTRSIAAVRSRGYEAPVAIHVAGVRDPRYVAGALESIVGVPAVPLELPPIPGVDALAMPAFVRAAALASRSLRKGRRFDLRKGEFAPPRAISGLREHRGKLAFGVALVFASFFFSTYVRFTAIEAEHASLSARLRTTTKDLFGTEAATAADARALLEGGAAIADPRPRLDALAVLDLISSKVPATVRHETFRLRIEIDDEARDGTFEISGQVPTIGDRDTIATGLEQHDCVTQVDRGPTTPAPNNAGQNYRLEGRLQCPEDAPEESSSSRREGGSR